MEMPIQWSLFLFLGLTSSRSSANANASLILVQFHSPQQLLPCSKIPHTHTWTRTHLPLPQCACFLHWATMHYWWSLINIENKCELSAWKTETLEQTFCIRKTGVCISGVSGPGLSQMVGSLYISKGISIITETSKKTEKSSWWVWRISTLGFHVGHAPTELAPSIFFADCFRTWLACTV